MERTIAATVTLGNELDLVSQTKSTKAASNHPSIPSSSESSKYTRLGSDGEVFNVDDATGNIIDDTEREVGKADHKRWNRVSC